MATAKDDFEQLVNAGLPHAQEMLREHGEFYPFGAVLMPDGKINMVAGPAHEEVPPVETVIAFLMEGFRAGAAELDYKAIAIFSNVNVSFGQEPIPEETAAIQAGLEHRDGNCVNVFLPYSGEGAEALFGELVAAPREGEIFAEAD